MEIFIEVMSVTGFIVWILVFAWIVANIIDTYLS